MLRWVIELIGSFNSFVHSVEIARIIYIRFPCLLVSWKVSCFFLHKLWTHIQSFTIILNEIPRQRLVSERELCAREWWAVRNGEFLSGLYFILSRISKQFRLKLFYRFKKSLILFLHWVLQNGFISTTAMMDYVDFSVARTTSCYPGVGSSWSLNRSRATGKDQKWR